MNLHLDNKIFIVSGGASGIGKAVCKAIAEENGIAVIADRDSEKVNILLNEIVAEGKKAEAVQIELTNDDSCRQLVEAVIQNMVV